MQIKHRKLNRLNGYDYSRNGFYFVTICTKDREDFFGRIENDKMILNEYGKIAEKYWLEIPKHFSNCKLYEFVIMPNHVHGIVIIENDIIVWNNDIVLNNDRCSIQGNRNMELLPKIISQYKSSVTREIRKQFDNFHFGWQKSFYDNIIRDAKSLNNIRQYIINNPLRWNLDKNNLQNITE